MQYDHCRARLLPHCGGDTVGEIKVQDDRHREVCIQPHWNFQQFRYAPHDFLSLSLPAPVMSKFFVKFVVEADASFSA